MLKYTQIKYILDSIFALVLIVILSPMILIISLIVYLSDFGPVFYRGERVGLFGKVFKIYKFRTMVVNAEKSGVDSTANSDSRVTKIGWWLRKFKLDELAQLLNILKGEMSFVGPRPEVKRFTDMYTTQEKKLLTLKPGMTDFASIWNFDEAKLLSDSKDPDKDYLEKIRPNKIKLQLKYLREISFTTDVKIIFLTLTKLITRS